LDAVVRIDILYDVTYDLAVRVVLDTSVLVAGLRSQLGASNQILLAVAEGRCIPLVTTAIFLEYQAVLLRPEHQLATGLNPQDIEGFLAAFASAAEPVELSFMWRPQLRDPSDEMILEAAINGGAVPIVTHNVDDFRPAAERFGIRILTPAELLKELAK
jgi:putative PIN family toxin of toxin-antitoxin system